MSNLAVKTYEFVTSKPAGIPDEWPAEVRELGESTTLPDESGEWVLMTREEFNEYKDEHQSAYETWSASYATVESVERIIAAAKVFANSIIDRFAAENVLLGITQAGMTGAVLNKMSGVMSALLTGSLYEAIARTKAIPESDYDATFITEARLLSFVNKIESYLGITLSTEL